MAVGRFTRAFFGSVAGLSLAYVGSLGGLRWWLARTYPDVNLTTTPRRAVPYESSPIAGQWVLRRFRSVQFRLPAEWQETFKTEQSTMWESNSLRMTLRTPSPLSHRRYRRALYQTLNILALLDRGLIMPPLLPQSLLISDQHVGPWQAYLFHAGDRLWVDLFDERTHLSISFSIIDSTRPDIDALIRDIIATIHVDEVTKPLAHR